MAESLAQQQAKKSSVKKGTGRDVQEWFASQPIHGHLFGDPASDDRAAAYRNQADVYAQQSEIAQGRIQDAQARGYEMGQGYRDALQSQYNTQPGYAENWYQTNQNAFNQPTAVSQFYTPGAYTKPGDAEQYWNGVAGSLNPKTTNSQGAMVATESALRNPAMVEQFVQSNLHRFNQPTYSAAALQEAQARGSTAGQRSADVYDQFVAGDAGAGQYYDQAVQQATNDALRAQAASGVIGSTAGANQINQVVAQLRAEQAREEANFGLEQQRLAGDLARNADMGVDQGARLTADLALGADQAELARMLGGVTAAQSASGHQLDRTTAFADIAGNVDQAMLGRMIAGGNIAGQSQDAELARLGLGMAGAGAVDAAYLNQLTAGGNAAMVAQQTEQARVQEALAAIFRGEQADVARNDAYAQYLQGLDDQYLDAVMASKLGEVGVKPTAAEARAAHLGELSQGIGIVSSLYSGGAIGGGGGPQMQQMNPGYVNGPAPGYAQSAAQGAASGAAANRASNQQFVLTKGRN